MSRNVKWRMQQAAHLLLEGHPSKEVAKMLKARPETLSRWKKHPDFIHEYERLREEMCEDMRIKLWRVAGGTFDHICESLNDGLNARMRFDSAIKFFKTIKIEQIFAPASPQAPEKRPQTIIVEDRSPPPAPPKPIIERIKDLADELDEIVE